MAYAQIDANYPNNNFFLGMVSTFTLDHVLGAIGCHETKFYKSIPQFLLNSGMSSMKTDLLIFRGKKPSIRDTTARSVIVIIFVVITSSMFVSNGDKI